MDPNCRRCQEGQRGINPFTTDENQHPFSWIRFAPLLCVRCMEDKRFYKEMIEVFDTSREDESDGINRVLSILAQVSLAVLLIFIMIAILFASEFKEKAAYFKNRLDTLENTPHAEALVEIQRQKLILAMERTNHYYRLKLGHLTFYRTDAAHQRQVHTENIITGRKIRYDFKRACEFAQMEMRNFDTFKHKYRSTILSQSGIASGDAETIYALLDKSNKRWFDDQVRETTTALYADTLRLQEDSKEGLAKYYQAHLSEVAELHDLAHAMAATPTRESINLLIEEVNRFVENELRRQHVQLLRTVSEKERLPK